MSFPSSNSQDPSYTSSPTSAARSARAQPSAWSSSSHQQSRRGLTPLTTAQSSSNHQSSTSSPSRNTFSPTISGFTALPSRQTQSRHSSISSSSSLFSPPGAPAPQAPASRSRNVTSSGSPHLASSAAAFTSQDRPGGSSGGGPSRLARQSPSLSSSTVGSPVLPSGGGSGQLTSLVVTQLNILLSTLKEDKDKSKWDIQADKIRKLVDANGMEVNIQLIRRLLQNNASYIFSTSARPGDGAGNYQLLVSEVERLNRDPDQAKKFAEALDTTDGDLFRDFDLSTFMEHFRLNPITKTALAVCCKAVTRSDLKTKADAILTNNFDTFLAALSEPIDLQDPLPPIYIAAIIDRVIHNPPRTWTEEKSTGLQYAIRLRYNRLGLSVPYTVGAALFLAELLSGQYPLVRLLQQTGPKGTQSLDACKDMLARADQSTIVYHQIANALLYTCIASNDRFDPAILVSGLRQHRLGQRIDWQDVVNAFDRPEVRITKPQFLLLYNALLPIAREDNNFDIQGLWGQSWTHHETQLSFVVAFLSTGPTELDVTQIPNLRSAFSTEEFADASDDIKDFAAQAATHPLVSYDATSALFTIIFSSQEAYNSAQTLGIPEAVINNNTDIFVCAASAVGKPWAPLQDQAMKQLLAPFLQKGLANSSFVMRALWIHDKTWLAGRLIENYNMNPRSLVLMFEHAQEQGWIDALISVKNDFGLDFTAYAHSNGLVDMQKWAEDHVAASNVPAIELSRAIIGFLRLKIDDELVVQRDHATPSIVPLKVRTVYALLDVIQGTVTDQEENAIQRSCIQAYPRLINFGYNFDDIIEGNGEHGNLLSPDSDAKMQEEYKDMYGGEGDARKMINTLRALKDSEKSEDQELFACMIHGLFDEYNCFGEYPLEALATTAVLFGGIINYGILHSRITLSVALYMVFEAVTEYSMEDSMYKFGLQALLHFTGRLDEWPQLCEQLCRIPGLQGTEVYAKAEEVIRRQTNAAEMRSGAADDQLALTNGDVDELTESAYQPFASVRVDPPTRSELYQDPDEETSDKVMFVLNNVSPRNLTEKFKDLEESLRNEHHQWFARYLVEDLAKAQPNFQKLYLEVLDLFDINVLWAEVVRQTYLSISKIINAESALTNMTDRNYLKHLSVWLGLLTLARDRPILHRNISFKDLLIEAHQSQRLLIAIPFTCKVLAQASKSNVFTPPNPWLMELLGLLMELYHFADLKLNLKFEIEVLCKELELAHKDIEPSSIIRNLPFGTEETLFQQYPPEADGFSGISRLHPMLASMSKRSIEKISPQDVMKSLPDLSTLLHYPPAPGNVSQQQLNNVLLTAAQRAIQEIISPVVDRSVTIAAISTAKLTEKDFAMEPDEERLRQSAHNVVKALSGSLALVTCKEPLRMSMSNTIRLLAPQNLPDQLPEGSILMFVNDNLDTVCKLIEDSAEEYSMAEIDAHLASSIEARRRHAQQRPNEPFNEPPASRWSFYIPEPYRQEQGGLNQHQMAIYEDFGRQMRMPPGTHTNNTSQDSSRQLPDVLNESYLPNLPTPAGESAIPRQVMSQQPPPSLQAQQSHHQVNGFITLQQGAKRVDELMPELQRVAREAQEDHIRDLATTSATRDVYEQLLHVVDSTFPKDQFATHCGSLAANMLYLDSKSRLEIEVLVQFLTQLCAMSVGTAKHLILYLSAFEEDYSFNAVVTACLLKALLVDLHLVDVQVAKAIRSKRPIVLGFFGDLIDEVVLSEQPLALKTDFALCYDALGKWLIEEPDNDLLKDLQTKLGQTIQVPNGLPTPSDEEEKAAQLEYIFEEWVQLQRPDVPERAHAAFINQLQEGHITSERDGLAAFIRTSIDMSVEWYEREGTYPFGNLDRAYIRVDALAKLIARLVSFQGDLDGSVGANKSKYLEQILCFVVLVINHHYATRHDRFSQRIFFRLFSCTMLELHTMRNHLGEAEADAPVILGQALLALQPQLFPGFAFAWTGLISHRMFVIPLMRPPYDKGWEIYTKLLCAMFEYLGELTLSIEASITAQDFYRSVLRIVLVLQHDYPEYLAANHLQLSSAVPSAATQLLNVLGSANPTPYQDLPDPFAPGMKLNRLEQSRQSPQIAADFHAILAKAGIKRWVDEALNAKEVKIDDAQSVLGVLEDLSTSQQILAINALAVYLGSAATVASSVFSASAPPAKLLEHLLSEAEPNLRHQIISAMANQIRYPNSHTHWFSTAMIHYFTSASEQVQQQLARVLVERLILARPHPWGLLVTIVELVKNQSYNIFEQGWMKAAPEIENMLLNVARLPGVAAGSPGS